MNLNIILFLIHTLESHYTPTFQLAKLLQSQGYQAVYAVPERYKAYIEAQSFATIELGGFPFGLGFEQDNREFEKSQDLYLDVLLDKISNRIYEDRKAKLSQIVEDLQPTLILIDMWVSTDFIILYPLLQKYSIKVAFLQPMLSTYRKQFSPPLFTPLLPNDKKAVQKAWKDFEWKGKINQLKQVICYLGHHDSRKVKQKFKENLLPEKHQIRKDNLYHYTFAGIPEFILAPEELEFPPSEKRENQHYLGNILYLDRKQTDIDERYEMVLGKIKQNKAPSPLGRDGVEQQPLIYCTFGTMHEKYESQIISFLQKLFSVFYQKPDWQLLCTANKQVRDALQNTELPNNIHLLSKVPQLALLPKVDVFIHHGGLGSVKEALHFQVPTLVYPITPTFDTEGNAARIFYHRLGLRGEISQDSPKEIAEKIQELLTNPLYKQNLQAFKEKTETKYTEERVLTLFEELLREPAWV
ncbi:glycosyltransferase [Thermoflexibacter ruber]|uniref:UDP:flavonoid glycosyltransferase YjiC, YdhE family n=1 Tax=Thermoflexibacter ruber TaxID=1003 RepID=A0A1I2FV22_9BACT|nr:nucleotide disphospho-sugar-binding domain-containing protein [Thermoflexibacter ruber]SFF09284.1 UDP:flavonoid glycosyltransferase YjiC, YdhE family [Thermoflexibacter ruber]